MRGLTKTAGAMAQKSSKKREHADMTPLGPPQKPAAKKATPKSSGTASGAPVGWLVGAVATPVEEKTVEKEKEVVPEEEVWDDRPLDWDELDQVGELVDMETFRPQSIQKFVSAHAEYMRMRGNEEMYKDIWRQVDDLQAKSDAQPDEGLGRVAGLGAGLGA